MSYQVGTFTDPKPDDEWFGELDTAIGVARAMNLTDENKPIAVWDGHAKVERLFLRGDEFKPV